MTQPIRVLIADDSVHARGGLRRLLATWPGIAVVGEAVNGLEAVSLIAQQRPDVVLIDLHMPVLDGIAATRLIKARWPAITVVVLTLYAAEQSAAMAAGADIFLVKGGAPGQLLGALGLEGAGGPA
jgi:DNA-binding NarL/FixJ family response regulator